MSNFPRKLAELPPFFDLPETITPSQVEFLGEQSSPEDDKLKNFMRRLFANPPPICRRAYLARVSFGEPGVSSVVLCVRNVEHIEEELQHGFKRMFSQVMRPGQFYDWMILDEKREEELRKVCKPFYEAR